MKWKVNNEERCLCKQGILLQEVGIYQIVLMFIINCQSVIVLGLYLGRQCLEYFILFLNDFYVYKNFIFILINNLVNNIIMKQNFCWYLFLEGKL